MTEGEREEFKGEFVFSSVTCMECDEHPCEIPGCEREASLALTHDPTGAIPGMVCTGHTFNEIFDVLLPLGVEA